MASEKETQLLQRALAAEINSREELANFMAQVCHESGGLNRLTEGFRYTRSIEQIPVRSAMREGREALEAARIEALNGDPEKLAELMYGGRMGNNEPGDGFKYHGRGYMQLTGKNNYRDAGEALGIDLVRNPDLAASPENAAKIATWFWQQNVPVAARADVTAATTSINGGPNGLPDRQSRYLDWYQALTPEFVASIGVERTRELPVTLRDLDNPHSIPMLSSPNHPDHALFKQASQGLEQLGQRAGFNNRQELENAAAAMVCEAKASRLTQIDHVLMSTDGAGLFAIQGRVDDPAHNRIYLIKADAVAQPIAQSTEQLDQTNQTLDIQQQQILERAPQQHHHGSRTL